MEPISKQKTMPQLGSSTFPSHRHQSQLETQYTHQCLHQTLEPHQGRHDRTTLSVSHFSQELRQSTRPLETMAKITRFWDHQSQRHALRWTICPRVSGIQSTRITLQKSTWRTCSVSTDEVSTVFYACCRLLCQKVSFSNT